MLSASVANNRLLGPWENFVFWDATNHLIRARALYDMVAMSFVLRFRASVLGGKMEIALVIGVGKVAAKTLTLTAAVGAEENQRVDFFLPQRTSWFANGAAVVLTSSVDAELIEFSPEFYPQGFAP